MTGGEDRFTLEIPRDPAFVATARMFASSLARHYEVDEDAVEDVKLAISEACKRALAASQPNDPVLVSAARDNGRLVFEVTQGDLAPVPDDRDTTSSSDEELAAGLSLELITALFEDATVTSDASGQPLVRFSVSSGTSREP